MPSLKHTGNKLFDPQVQLKYLETHINGLNVFDQDLTASGLSPLKPRSLDVLQINVGKVCNQSCHHCHVDAAPDRKESMTTETFQQCLDVVRKNKFSMVDITGGAPELNPNFRWFVSELKKLKVNILVRCNLTIINSHKRFSDLPEFYAENNVEVIASMPYFTKNRTDSQRGDGVFESSIHALQMLNAVGYGMEGSDLRLNLVYNPSGAFLPGDQLALEQQFKKELFDRFSINFNNLYCITNLPISRFLNYLITSGNYQNYMEKLSSSFNPVAAQNVMCREMISVGWDGSLYDCDFNQMLELGVDLESISHISEYDHTALIGRNIRTNQHCYGCTAGTGSSCGGSVV